jgi:hypothetical protein
MISRPSILGQPAWLVLAEARPPYVAPPSAMSAMSAAPRRVRFVFVVIRYLSSIAVGRRR